MANPTGHRKLLEHLRADGIQYLFGNSGSSEDGLLDEVSRFPRITYILGLQEAAIVGVADGYAQATRFLFQRRRCSGIEYCQGSETKQVSANAEVAICAGAINSLELLLLSGIGDALAIQRRAD